MRLDDTEIVIVKISDSRINFWSMTKIEAVDEMKIDDLSKKVKNKKIIYYSDGK